MGGARVGPRAIGEYLRRMRERYEGARKEARGPLLDEMEEVTGYHRKALIRRMHAGEKAGRPRAPRRRGRPRRYGPPVVGALRLIWTAAGYPWSVRLKALLPDWLPHARRHLALSADTERKLRAMSPRQMDRSSIVGEPGESVSRNKGCHEAVSPLVSRGGLCPRSRVRRRPQ
jgi:hypothetical protein